MKVKPKRVPVWQQAKEFAARSLTGDSPDGLAASIRFRISLNFLAGYRAAQRDARRAAKGGGR